MRAANKGGTRYFSASALDTAPVLRDSVQVQIQKLNRIPNCAANGMPTVVPGPKKSPNAPAGTRNWFKLVIGCV